MNKRLLLIICGILLLAGGLFFAVKSLLATYAPRAERTEALAPAAEYFAQLAMARTESV